MHLILSKLNLLRLINLFIATSVTSGTSVKADFKLIDRTRWSFHAMVVICTHLWFAWDRSTRVIIVSKNLFLIYALSYYVVCLNIHIYLVTLRWADLIVRSSSSAGSITGSTARCYAMLEAFKDFFRDYQAPPDRVGTHTFSHLHVCTPGGSASYHGFLDLSSKQLCCLCLIRIYRQEFSRELLVALNKVIRFLYDCRAHSLGMGNAIGFHSLHHTICLNK